MALKTNDVITFVDPSSEELQIKKDTDWGFRITVGESNADHDAIMPCFELEPDDALILIKFLQDGLAEMDF